MNWGRGFKALATAALLCAAANAHAVFNFGAAGPGAMTTFTRQPAATHILSTDVRLAGMTVIPEPAPAPGTLALLGLGLVVAGGAGIFRRNASQK